MSDETKPPHGPDNKPVKDDNHEPEGTSTKGVASPRSKSTAWMPHRPRLRIPSPHAYLAKDSYTPDQWRKYIEERKSLIEGGVYLDNLIQQRTTEISAIEFASSSDDQAQKEFVEGIQQARMKVAEWLGPLESKDPWLARAVRGYMPAMKGITVIPMPKTLQGYAPEDPLIPPGAE
ncbi:MAG: hypothetical protein LQ350_005471 [Teloschistes chrysophthalmus]|nr:MAG: hypothetical protein LQ350_005471 [Niorma chrysophthalma]